MAWTSGKGLGTTLHAVANLFSSIHKLNSATAAQRLINITKTVTRRHRPKLAAQPQTEFQSRQKVKLKLVQEQAAKILRENKP
jgi:hypothetical protein